MRSLIFLPLLLLAFGCGNSKQLNGTWIPVQQEMGGTVLPAASFEKQSLVLNDSTYVFTAESVDKGVVRCNGNKMDIYGKDGVNTGKHFTAIYKVENDQLHICYNLAGDGYPADYKTTGKPMYFLCVFKKAAK